MKFRLSVQPKPTRQELKSVAPSLLSDPAFSPDPQANPYFVTGEPAWASSPPVGHPPLKNKTRRQPGIFAQPAAGFLPAPPPNSPVAPTAASNTHYFPFPGANPSSAPASTAQSSKALDPRLPIAATSVTDLLPRSPSPPTPSVIVKEEKKRRMPFLSRRKSSQPTPPPIPELQKKNPAKSKHISLPLNDVTQRPDLTPVPGSRVVSEPVKNVESRPNIPRRAATTGASTPTSAITTATGVSTATSSSRTQDLDRIDELDETNPWGIALHHDGPYEAAVQAIRRSDNRMPLAFSHGNLNDYPRQALHAHGNLYVPPQVPTGVSLKLSPGQILPRNFLTQPPYYPSNRDSPPASQPSTLKPPTTSSGPPRPRYQSQPLPPPREALQDMQRVAPVHARIIHEHNLNSRSPPVHDRERFNSRLPPPTPQLPDPHPLSNPHPSMAMEPRDPEPPKQQLPNPHPIMAVEPRDPVPPKQEPESDKLDDVSFSIGMAMLQPEASESSNGPSYFLHPKTPGEKEFDPYDPIHLEKEHYSRTPSPLLNVDSTPSPDPKSRSLTPESATYGKTSASADDHKQASSSQGGHSDPPPYTSPVPIPAKDQYLKPVFPVPQGQSRSSSRAPSPGPTSFPKSNGNTPSDESGHSRPEMNARPDRSPRNVSPVPIPPNQREVTQDTRLAVSAPVLVGRVSQEHNQNVGPPPVQDRERLDARSTHHSVSTYASSQMTRNGGPPPPHRRVPKHLVMPTPLNTNNNINNIGMRQPPSFIQQQPSASPFSPVKVQVQVRSQSHLPYPQAASLRAPMQPISSPIRAQEIQMASSKAGKLRKRVSTLTPPTVGNIPSAPLITTVSFASPVIGFNHSPANEKGIGRARSEKIPKRVLSKRRTDL